MKIDALGIVVALNAVSGAIVIGSLASGIRAPSRALTVCFIAGSRSARLIIAAADALITGASVTAGAFGRTGALNTTISVAGKTGLAGRGTGAAGIVAQTARRG